MHSCKKIPLGEHFRNKEKAREIFDFLVEKVKKELGECQVISLPCCIHLFGKYDFLAALPKKNELEIRFNLNQELKGSRVKLAVAVSAKEYKNCFDIKTKEEIDQEMIGWIKEAYLLRGVRNKKEEQI